MHPGLWKIITGAWLGAVIVWVAMAFTTKRAARRQSPRVRLTQMGVMAVGAWLLFSNRAAAASLARRFVPSTAMVAYIGVALTIAGIAFAIWARFFLGTNWSATPSIKQGHELVRSGPYAIVRHPIYSGFLLGLLGTAIYAGDFRALAAFGIVLIGLKWKSLTEESLMQQQFGAQYVDYRRQVKGIIPFVW